MRGKRNRACNCTLPLDVISSTCDVITSNITVHLSRIFDAFEFHMRNTSTKVFRLWNLCTLITRGQLSRGIGLLTTHWQAIVNRTGMQKIQNMFVEVSGYMLQSSYSARSDFQACPGGGGGRPPPPTRPHPHPHTTSNYRVPPAHRFNKYKLRFLYFRLQKLTPYSIKFKKKRFWRSMPPDPSRSTLRRWRTSPPPPPPPTLSLGQPWVRAWMDFNLSDVLFENI